MMPPISSPAEDILWMAYSEWTRLYATAVLIGTAALLRGTLEGGDPSLAQVSLSLGPGYLSLGVWL